VPHRVLVYFLVITDFNTVWIMAPRHPQIANRIAKSKKAVPNLAEPSGTKIPNLMKYPGPEGIVW